MIVAFVNHDVAAPRPQSETPLNRVWHSPVCSWEHADGVAVNQDRQKSWGGGGALPLVP